MLPGNAGDARRDIARGSGDGRTVGSTLMHRSPWRLTTIESGQAQRRLSGEIRKERSRLSSTIYLGEVCWTFDYQSYILFHNLFKIIMSLEYCVYALNGTPANLFSGRPLCSFRRTSSFATKSDCFLQKRNRGSLTTGASGTANQPYLYNDFVIEKKKNIYTYVCIIRLRSHLLRFFDLLHVHRRRSKRINIFGYHLRPSSNQIDIVLLNVRWRNNIVFRIEFAS